MSNLSAVVGLMFTNEFWPNFASNIVGGLLLAYLFFVFREYVWPEPIFAGVWECEYIVADSVLNKYKGMHVFYHVTLIQAGKDLRGSGERDREISALNGAMTYRKSDRVIVKVEGVIERRILRKTIIRIYWVQKGHERETSAFFELKVSGRKNKDGYIGTFYTTAANCSGLSQWKRIA